mmetsp:Transcript_22001/g.39571  ORF Transcript_22001/g.39571 Transcript_22001/m.39571 type:complete len:317 (+) Transcript_22001:1556-2506(+)
MFPCRNSPKHTVMLSSSFPKSPEEAQGCASKAPLTFEGHHSQQGSSHLAGHHPGHEHTASPFVHRVLLRHSDPRSSEYSGRAASLRFTSGTVTYAVSALRYKCRDICSTLHSEHTVAVKSGMYFCSVRAFSPRHSHAPIRQWKLSRPVFTTTFPLKTTVNTSLGWPGSYKGHFRPSSEVLGFSCSTTASATILVTVFTSNMSWLKLFTELFRNEAQADNCMGVIRIVRSIGPNADRCTRCFVWVSMYTSVSSTISSRIKYSMTSSRVTIPTVSQNGSPSPDEFTLRTIAKCPFPVLKYFSKFGSFSSPKTMWTSRG